MGFCLSLSSVIALLLILYSIYLLLPPSFPTLSSRLHLAFSVLDSSNFYVNSPSIFTGFEPESQRIDDSRSEDVTTRPFKPLMDTSQMALINRGGVEDTRLEAKAKAKDTKKIRGQGQGQGQPFRGQTLSRPRTRMLEAKAKDQGHKAQVLSKKKKKKRSSQKFFRRSPKKKKKRSSQKFFKRSPRKNAFQKIFQPLHKILTFQKIVLSSSRGQANFRGLEASRPRPRT